MPAFILGTQYFRPPFPKARFWETDIKSMRDAGLNTVQMWLVWGWIEPEPGRFVFDDYDRMTDLADREGMGVVLSALPEINPFWLPRLHPDGLMVDIEGHRVLSCNRGECISGHVPGCCSDHPAVHARMTGFLHHCAEHFGKRGNLLAWDVWNENRWRNNAPEIVCFCEHSLESQRQFLRGKYGDLDALGEAWGRRLCAWEDIRFGRALGNSYPELRDFTHWICWRAREMIRWRVRAVREVDGTHPISSHTGNPTVFGGLNLNENIFSRGIDWDIAEGDGYGYSSFPVSATGEMSPVDYCVRTSALSTAGGGKPIWMSELQGGPTAHSRRFGRPISGAEQQAWIWTGISRGAKAMVFWCWRPEVFGNEANGFGFIADDGQVESRKAAMKKTSQVLAEHDGVIANYRPDAPRVGVLFQRDAYIYSWLARECRNPQHSAPKRLLAYPRALERLNAHYAVYDDRHVPEDARDLKLMIVPNPEGLDDGAAQWLVKFAEAGGTVLIEGAAGAFGPDTFWRYPNERPFYKAIGLNEELHRTATEARRIIPAKAVGNDRPIDIPIDEFECSFAQEQPGVFALEPDGLPMLANVCVGKGRVVCVESVIGERMDREDPETFDTLILSILRLAGAEDRPEICGDGRGFCTCRLGTSGDRQLLLISNLAGGQNVTIAVDSARLPDGTQVDEWFGHPVSVSQAEPSTLLKLDMAEYDHAVIEWR